VKKIVVWLSAALVLLLGVLFLRSCRTGGLDVDPHARQEIEKAKHR